MNKKRDFNNILDECLTKVQKGESIEACLATHPEHAGELEPLLRTAVAARQATLIQPRREFRDRAAMDFQAAIRQIPEKGAGIKIWRRRFLEVVAGVVFVLLAGTGLVSASTSSLPDEPLYTIKTATETAWLALTPSDVGKAELYVKFTNRRVEEIIAMAGEGKVAPLEKATDRLNSEMNDMAMLTAPVQVATSSKYGMATSPPMLTGPATTMAPTTTLTETSTIPGITTTTTPSESNPPPVTETFTTDNGIAPPRAAGHANGTDEEETLRETLARSAAANSAALQEELDKAPASVQDALQRALEVADSGYQQNLSNLGQQ